MRIVFFGSPGSALPSLQALIGEGHSIELVVTQPDRPSGRGKKTKPCPVKEYASRKGIPAYQPHRIRKDPEAENRLREAAPDVNVVVAYGQIIPGPLIYLPRYRSLNVHFSLLPAYRGASPVQWAILNGESETGVTIIELNEKMDEGDILAVERAAVRPGETASELQDRLALLGARLLVETLAGIDALETRPQDHSRATYAPLIRKEDGRIDWTQKADRIERMVRAFTPWPTAFGHLGGRRLIVVSGQAEDSASPGQPGEILSSSKEGIRVVCGAATVFRIESLQPENRRPMPAYSYWLGARMRLGDRWG